MTDAVESSRMIAPRTLVFRRLFRVAGVVSVILGGWCCWMALRAPRPAQDIEAYEEWKEESPANPAPPVADRRELRLTAEITDVISTAAAEEPVVISALYEPFEDDAQPVEAVRSETDAPLTSADGIHQTSARDNAPGAWLTGTIDESDLDVELADEAAQELPAWKRSTRSQKRTARRDSPANLPRR